MRVRAHTRTCTRAHEHLITGAYACTDAVSTECAQPCVRSISRVQAFRAPAPADAVVLLAGQDEHPGSGKVCVPRLDQRPLAHGPQEVSP